jgi:hypothetical protein
VTTPKTLADDHRSDIGIETDSIGRTDNRVIIPGQIRYLRTLFRNAPRSGITLTTRV